MSGRQRGRGPRLGKCTRLSVTSHERGGTRSERRPASREDADEDTHRARRQRLCCRSCCRNRRKGYRTSSSCACVAHGRASEWPTEKRATDNDPDARDDGISVPERKKRCRQRRCRRHSSARSLGLAGDSCSRDRMERRALALNVASTRVGAVGGADRRRERRTPSRLPKSTSPSSSSSRPNRRHPPVPPRLAATTADYALADLASLPAQAARLLSRSLEPPPPNFPPGPDGDAAVELGADPIKYIVDAQKKHGDVVGLRLAG